MAFKKACCSWGFRREAFRLTAEAVQCAALALQSVDDVHGGHRLALGVLGIGDSVADDVLQEHFENAARLLVDEAADALDTATTSQASNSRFGDALNVITQNFTMPLSSSFTQSFAALATSRHLGE